MAGVNKATIMGRLGRDPETTYTAGGVAICKFSMATSRKNKQGEEITQWHRCTSFSKSAELIQQYVHKGDLFYIEGEINYGEYEKDGVKRYTTDIIVREFNFIGGGKGQGNQQNNGNQQGNQQNQNQGYQNQPQNSNQGQNTQGYQPQNQNGYNQPNQNQNGQQSGYNQIPQDRNGNADADIPF